MGWIGQEAGADIGQTHQVGVTDLEVWSRPPGDAATTGLRCCKGAELRRLYYVWSQV